ncbi:MAG: DegV family protein [Tissierellia bacterium]|nr:DegV family protein [Tissierellia bacterium]
MNREKIAILTDTGSDIGLKYANEHDINLIPLHVNFSDRSYREVVELTSEELYEKLELEIPKTSIASIEEIKDEFKKIREKGIKKVIAIAISSNLSGFCNAMRLAAKEMEDMDIFVYDTKNISIATGFYSIYARELIDQGLSFEEIKEKMNEKITASSVFFTVKSLKHLIKGGRIGRVKGSLGEFLSIKPIISCDPEGVYYNYDVARGDKNSLKKLIKAAQDKISECNNYYLAIGEGNNEKGLAYCKEIMKKEIEGAKIYYEMKIAPSLGTHTGPGLMGIGVFNAD